MKTVLYVQLSSGMGGAATSLLTLAKGVRKLGYRPIIAGQQDREGLWEAAEKEGIDYRPLYITSWTRSHTSVSDILHLPNRLNTIRRLVGICKKEHVDLIHTNQIQTLDGAITSRILGIPHIFHVRDMFTDPSIATWWGGPKATVRTVAKYSDRIIAISNAVAKEFGAVDDDKIRVIYNAVEFPISIIGTREEARREFDLPFDAIVAVIVGQVIDRKGHGDFVKALKQLHERGIPVYGLIAGNGEPTYIDQLKSEAGEIFRKGFLRFTGHLTPVWPAYTASDIMVCPSWTEGFGRVVVEGMLAGKPVIAASVGGIVEIIKHRVNGVLVPPASPRELACAIYEILNDRDFAHNIAAKGRCDAEIAYSPDLHARNILNVYQNLC